MTRAGSRAVSDGPVVVVGAGAVGLGVLVPLLRQAGAEHVVVSRTATQAEQLREHDVPAVAAGAARGLTAVVEAASLVLVAVRPHHLVDVAAALAPGLQRRRAPVSVLVCDNRRHGARWLRACVAEHADERALRHVFAGVLVDRIARRTVHGPGGFLLVEGSGTLMVDRDAWRAAPSVATPALEDIGLTPVGDFGARVARKVHVFSAGHAATAYLGQVLGHQDISAALRDPEVVRSARAVMREGQAGLAACHGPVFAGGDRLVDQCLERFADPLLGDTTARVARDPLRKLGRDERVVAPARLARAAGHATPALELLAAAVVVTGRGDPLLDDQLRRRGVAGLVAHRAGLRPDDPFVLGVVRTLTMLDEEHRSATGGPGWQP